MYYMWQNQEEALQFALQHPSCMLDMDMGTGKTRVAIDAMFARKDVYRVLVVCPKAIIPVWRQNLEKFAPAGWACWDEQKGSVRAKAESFNKWLHRTPATKQIVVMNYDVVWRCPMGDLVLNSRFNMVILDESHRAKAAGSKVSKYLALLGRRVRYKMCLSGTAMANSPLDVYGQYRFLDPAIFGTNYYYFLQRYAILGGPECRFVIGFKNQKELKEKFQSIAYSCRMSDVASRLKLPRYLPPMERIVKLPGRDMATSKRLAKEFKAECGSSGVVVVGNVLTKMIRLQQIAAGFCQVQDSPLDPKRIEELNTAKEDALVGMLQDLPSADPVVVFCVFKHDLLAAVRAAGRADREAFEMSGRTNELEKWRQSEGAVLAVQIRAGAEGVDMTLANYAVYFSLPYSLAVYEQSKARLYRPGQTRPVSFIHLIAEETIDESIYKSLMKKKDVIEAIKEGTFDFGFIK